MSGHPKGEDPDASPPQLAACQTGSKSWCHWRLSRPPPPLHLSWWESPAWSQVQSWPSHTVVGCTTCFDLDALSRHLAMSCLVLCLCQRAWRDMPSSALASPWMHVLGPSGLAPDQLPRLLALHASVPFPAQVQYSLSAISTHSPEANDEGIAERHVERSTTLNLQWLGFRARTTGTNSMLT